MGSHKILRFFSILILISQNYVFVGGKRENNFCLFYIREYLGSRDLLEKFLGQNVLKFLPYDQYIHLKETNDISKVAMEPVNSFRYLKKCEAILMFQENFKNYKQLAADVDFVF